MDDELLLTEEELSQDKFDGLHFDVDDIRYVLEAQLAKAKPLIAKQIFEEIESHPGILRSFHRWESGNVYQFVVGCDSWQVLKAKWLGDK